MFAKMQRARTKDVRAAILSGKTRHSDHFSIRVHKHNDPVRVSVIVSKKVATTAVARNTLKRRIRANIDHGKLPATGTMLIYAKKGAEGLSQKDMSTSIQTILQ